MSKPRVLGLKPRGLFDPPYSKDLFIWAHGSHGYGNSRAGRPRRPIHRCTKALKRKRERQKVYASRFLHRGPGSITARSAIGFAANHPSDTLRSLGWESTGFPTWPRLLALQAHRTRKWKPGAGTGKASSRPGRQGSRKYHHCRPACGDPGHQGS